MGLRPFNRNGLLEQARTFREDLPSNDHKQPRATLGQVRNLNLFSVLYIYLHIFDPIVVCIDNRYGNGKYLRTGDMAFMVNNRIYYSGRIKDMIIVRGQNYYAQVHKNSSHAFDNRLKKFQHFFLRIH